MSQPSESPLPAIQRLGGVAAWWAMRRASAAGRCGHCRRVILELLNQQNRRLRDPGAEFHLSSLVLAVAQ